MNFRPYSIGLSVFVILLITLAMTASSELLMYASYTSNTSNLHLAHDALVGIVAAYQQWRDPLAAAVGVTLTSQQLPVCTKAQVSFSSLASYLVSQGEPSSLSVRQFIAKNYGIDDYRALAPQDQALIADLSPRMSGCIMP